MKKLIMLSLAAAATLTLVGCSDDDNEITVEPIVTPDPTVTPDPVVPSDPAITVNDVQFTGIPTPTGSEQLKLQTSSEVEVNGEAQEIGFTKLMATGHIDNGEMYGLSKDVNDMILTMDDGNPYICNGTSNPSGSGSGLDYVSILQKNDKLYMVSQFECQIGSIYVSELEQDAQSGELSAKPDTMKFVSQKSEFGGYVHCAGMKTPWETHLGSEEYPPDAKGMDLNETSAGDFYFDFVQPFWGDMRLANPYYYGWTPEVSIDTEGNAVYTKHYALGRLSHELSYVMPDNKTVYLSDDGTNVGLFMFKADTEKDLSAGTLYAAKWTQTSAANGGAADILWIELGHATNAEIRAMLDPDNNIMTNDGVVFDDIMEVVEDVNGTCPTGYASINTSAYFECAKVKTGMEKAAAFLETRRYAAIKGATTEFRKEEGITYDANNKTLYVAMSAIERGMEDNAKSGEANTKYDEGGNNDIKVDYNYCGAVYALDVNDDMVATNMYAVVTGEMIEEDADGNECHLDKISNPDNVAMMPNSNILAIGEDTGKHVNNIVWAYDVNTGELTRILATPAGAETTAPFFYNDVNGYGYMTAVTQHPDEDTDDFGQSSVGVLGNWTGLVE